MKPHKHAELIKAWADGATIQFREKGVDFWTDWTNENASPSWRPDNEYRIKPEPKPDFETYLCKINHQWHEFNTEPCHSGWACIKLIWDGETGKLKSAEVLK